MTSTSHDELPVSAAPGIGRRVTPNRDSRFCVPQTGLLADAEERQRIYQAGGYVKRGRVMGVLEPSRTIGDLDVKKMCDKAVIAEPYVDAFNFEEYLGKMVDIPAYVILASDGVFDVMDGKTCAKIVNKMLAYENRSGDCAKILCDEAKKRGSDDDITAVVVFLE